jgi:glycosyltransferase involved in cell wall biosynthesis
MVSDLAGATPAIKLSVVVKALNEAEKIEACLRSLLAATDPRETEIIVADSLSEDATVEIAMRFPVRVVQLRHREDRGCGSAGQLGFQVATGDRLLLVDGDMEINPAFIEAAHAALDADPKLAGVGGQIIDKVMTLEFQRRNQKVSGNLRPGIHQHLNGGGMFRMAALRQTGYLTDRNLHACEELELGLRLTALGWHCRRLDIPAVYHYGHRTAPFRLLLARWRTKYVFGQGELLRARLGSPGWWRILRTSAPYLTALVWWLAILASVTGWAASGGETEWIAILGLVLLTPFALQFLRKRNVLMAIYSVCLVNFHAAGLIAGLLRSRIDPRQPIESIERHHAAPQASPAGKAAGQP